MWFRFGTAILANLRHCRLSRLIILPRAKRCPKTLKRCRCVRHILYRLDECHQHTVGATNRCLLEEMYGAAVIEGWNRGDGHGILLTNVYRYCTLLSRISQGMLN